MPSPSPSPSPITLPADRTSLHTVLLPPTPAHRLQAALAGLLEEQLLDDPADLHFALAPNAASAMNTGQSFEVLVCDKAWLKALLDKATIEGKSSATILPESPAMQDAGWSLAQFDFAPKSLFVTRLQAALLALQSSPALRLVRIGLLALVVIQIVGLNLWALRDKAQLSSKSEQVSRILKQTYPETNVVVDAPAQMQKALAKSQAERGTLNELSLEVQLAKKAIPNKAYTQIDFANGELKLAELKGKAP